MSALFILSSMSSMRVSFQESLEKRVLQTGRCCGCGACVITCPFNCLDYKINRPELVLECRNCGICAKACPQYDWSLKEMENSVLHRERRPDESFGVFRRVVAAQATDKEILAKAQDGGLVTALLARSFLGRWRRNRFCQFRG